MKKPFHKYNSLTNHYQGAFIDSIQMSGLDDGDWVATEKIHGSNYSFWSDGNEVWTAKRTQVLHDPSIFYSANKVDKYKPNVKAIYRNLVDSGIIENEDIMAIYGELFGGSFFGTKDPTSKTVQSGMNYHPSTEFAAYDIMVKPIDGEAYCLSYLEMLDAVGDEIPLCPEVGRGTLYDLLDLDNDFSSLVPAMYGLTPPDGEHVQSEGFVIRPINGEKYVKSGRCIIKSKNSKFNEKGGKAKSVGISSEGLKLSEEECALYSSFSVYLNSARIQSVISKIGEVTWKDFAKLVGLLLQDAKVDYEADTGVSLRQDDFWIRSSKLLNALSCEVVRDHLKRTL